MKSASMKRRMRSAVVRDAQAAMSWEKQMPNVQLAELKRQL